MSLVFPLKAFNLTSNNFFNWLLKQLKKDLLEEVEVKKLSRFKDRMDLYFEQDVSVKKVFLAIVENINYKKQLSCIIFELDPNATYLNKALLPMQKLIESGALDIRPYPIFKDVMKKFKNKKALLEFTYTDIYSKD